MTKAKSEILGALRAQLDAVYDAITESGLQLAPSKNLEVIHELKDSPAILDECQRALEHSEKTQNKTIRTIHHLACTGGTLIARTIAALPNTYVLSEVHPNSPIRDVTKLFLPSDIAALSVAAKIPDASRIAWEIVSTSITLCSEGVAEYGGNLVVRDHSHSDFNGPEISKSGQSTLQALLKGTFDSLLSVVTVRDPRDSFASLKANGWVHFSPPDFETYCARYHNFLDALDGVPLFRYEDFVAQPEETLQAICVELDLPFDLISLDVFSAMKLSGDSGRSADFIEERNKRNNSADLDAKTHTAQSLFQRLGYAI